MGYQVEFPVYSHSGIFMEPRFRFVSGDEKEWSMREY